MGEIAEMHLDGTLCERCGVYMGEPCGYPRYCHDCFNDMDDEERRELGLPVRKRKKHNKKHKQKPKVQELQEHDGVKVGEKAIVRESYKPGRNRREIVLIDRITYDRWGAKYWSQGIWYCYAWPCTEKNMKAYEQSNKDLGYTK